MIYRYKKAFFFTFIKKYIWKNINGTTIEYTDMLLKVSITYIGTKLESNAENNAEKSFFVNSLTIK